MAGELLALALVLARSGIAPFNWELLGMASFVVQWIALSSAACLCKLRPFFSQHSLLLAASLSFGLILLITLVVSLGGQYLLYREIRNPWSLASHVLMAAIFGGIVLRYFYIQQQLLVQEEAELKARIQALQSRIRPHFLFNCMNSIVSLIGSDPDRAEHVVEDLSDLFRASLAEPAQVPIKQEIALCKQYMSIEKLRLDTRLDVVWEVGELPDEVKIPSLLLQPIFENAIYHGIQPLAQGGTVEISIQARDNRLSVVVRNPLPANNQPKKTGNRIALDNIRHRLAAYYGERAHFSAEGAGELFITQLSYPI